LLLRRRTSHSRGQSLVEFALVSPLFLLLMFGAIDFGRLIYTYSAISSASREGARLIATEPQQQSDCTAIARMEQVGQGFPLRVDPQSLAGNTDPNNPGAPYQPSTPPPGIGYIYIWPAVATATPQDQGTNCTGAQRGGSTTVKHVAVEIQYHFVPATPLLQQIAPDIVVKTISVVQVEY
jgi:Flp pilus assembly protein TadG